jgi:hypothetical protein
MNRDAILRMAREAGLAHTQPRAGQYDGGRVAGSLADLTKFAVLVAAAEREAKLMAQLEQAKAENERLQGLLLEAANEIEDWGSYADFYFQHKHDLAGAVSRFRKAATPTQEDV